MHYLLGILFCIVIFFNCQISEESLSNSEVLNIQFDTLEPANDSLLYNLLSDKTWYLIPSSIDSSDSSQKQFCFYKKNNWMTFNKNGTAITFFDIKSDCSHGGLYIPECRENAQWKLIEKSDSIFLIVKTEYKMGQYAICSTAKGEMIIKPKQHIYQDICLTFISEKELKNRFKNARESLLKKHKANYFTENHNLGKHTGKAICFFQTTHYIEAIGKAKNGKHHGNWIYFDYPRSKERNVEFINGNIFVKPNDYIRNVKEQNIFLKDYRPYPLQMSGKVTVINKQKGLFYLNDKIVCRNSEEIINNLKIGQDITIVCRHQSSGSRDRPVISFVKEI